VNRTIGSGQLNSERNPATVANQMTLAAQLGPVSRIRPRLRPPKTARIELPSTTACDQSISPKRAIQSSKEKWISRQMPASCQSRNRRQQVMPEPQPSSCGNISHGMPLRSTKRIPVRHGPASAVCLPWVYAVEAAATVESDSTKHREVEECSWIEHPSTGGSSFPRPATRE
jgi:hypothetical protein